MNMWTIVILLALVYMYSEIKSLEKKVASLDNSLPNTRTILQDSIGQTLLFELWDLHDPDFQYTHNGMIKAHIVEVDETWCELGILNAKDELHHFLIKIDQIKQINHKVV